MLIAKLPDAWPGGWLLDGDAIKADGVLEGWFTFETSASRGKEHVRLKGGHCWTLFTCTLELKGFEEKSGPTREKGAEHGSVPGRKSWSQVEAEEMAVLGVTRQPYCMTMGGGQAGIGLDARLKRLRVPTIILDQNDRPGDSWCKRYAMLCTHDPVWSMHMPYIPFPDHWPVFIPKDKMGDWLEMYTKVMELNYWSAASYESAHYEEAEEEWKVNVDLGGKTLMLRTKHLVLATGVHSLPRVPESSVADGFIGQQYHSSDYQRGED